MPALFYEDIYAALGELVRATGGMKTVGSEMRPEMLADAAGNWLKDCLNADRREKLDPQQVVWLLKRGHAYGVHDGLAYINMEVGYEPPRPISNEATFKTALDDLRVMQESMAKTAALVSRLASENPALLNMKRSD